MIKIGINGFGRIGRCILRAYAECGFEDRIKIVAINNPNLSISDAIYLLKYDSTHGIFNIPIKENENSFYLRDNEIFLSNYTTPEETKWNDIDIVLECSGKFTAKNKAMSHITKGKAKKVLVSAPSEDADATVVIGVNEHSLNTSHQIISIGSCTTNCLAPIAKILNDSVGIESGFMTTIHAITNDQSTLDRNHKDLRRGRTNSLSLIPTSTGAAKTIGMLIPSLAGKIDGAAIRVPVHNVSLMELCFYAKSNITNSQLNEIFLEAKSNQKNIIQVSDEELVSIDFNHSIYSAIIDLTQTKVIRERFCRVVAWYDNEWGFVNRMLDTCCLISKLNL